VIGYIHLQIYLGDLLILNIDLRNFAVWRRIADCRRFLRLAPEMLTTPLAPMFFALIACSLIQMNA